MSKKVAIYCRVSTIEQEEGFSIDSQYHNIKEYCKNQGHEIYNLYEDRGISGKNITNRPGIKQLLEDATKNKFDLVVVWKLNRISRKLLDINFNNFFFFINIHLLINYTLISYIFYFYINCIFFQ